MADNRVRRPAGKRTASAKAAPPRRRARERIAATLSYRTARYRSADLTLSTTELTDNVGHPLQPQTPWMPGSSPAMTCHRT